jgi:hypothetical protein
MVASAFLGPLRRISSEIGLFFQDSYGSLNPRMMVWASGWFGGAGIAVPAAAKLVVIAMWRGWWTVLRTCFWGKMWVAGGECLRRVGELDEKKGCRGGFAVCWKSLGN